MLNYDMFSCLIPKPEITTISNCIICLSAIGKKPQHDNKERKKTIKAIYDVSCRKISVTNVSKKNSAKLIAL